ncbi:sigma-70 family RNA polymerase sigma factor [Micromonospora sp. WMMD1128]|uniref:RNA polymerase sigma factor n=1 Tax=unclassified Micromonospora TaxID=2617518 RepID=UPI00248B8E38|nr:MULTISPECIES: sigma-70 family RNA polymerase sigma factor [unclassified Micromonospora]WBB73454.1 sigma-70 family RNA polymerase sigma factor [Micromonospora sp. WMMD1128]WFE33153.1 sigma-70 family RNA polymerase sigma factor [Micromonospora sp. WMMD975]
MSDIQGTAARTPADDEDARRAEALRVKADHDREFATFVEGSYHTVERILRSVWWDREVVADALHEAYLHGRVKWPELRDHVRPIGWIVRTARFNLLKDRDRRQREAAVAPEDLPPAPHSDIADVWEAQETLRAWLRQLPARHAEVFQMSREGFSNQEIARILGLTENSVRCYKAAAKRGLGELAEEAGFTRSPGRRRQGGSRGSR